jgi:hypothetical protein
VQVSPRQRWLAVGVFAVAMGYLEAAVVFYLRTMVKRIDPYQAEPLPQFAGLAAPEMFREFATMVMLMAVGWMVGRTWRGRIGFALLTFGIWDISYYIFLRPLSGWPPSLLNWDVLFLIPLPWWGPIWAPISIAFLMILFGLLATLLEQGEPPIWPGKTALALCSAGVLLALYVFMADSIHAVPHGELAVRRILPKSFLTGPFLVALGFMAVPVFDMVRQLSTRYR